MAIQSKKNQGKFKKIVVFSALLLVALFLANSTYKVYKKERQTSLALEQKNKEVETLANRQKELTVELESLKTQEGIEFELRKKFGVVKPGEQVAVVVEGATTTATSTETVSFFDKIKNWFK